MCHRCERGLSSYLDSSLKDRQEKDVTRHLAECEHCSKRYQQLLSNRQALRGTPQTAVPSVLQKQLWSRLTEAQNPPAKLQYFGPPRKPIPNVLGSYITPRLARISLASLAAAAALLAFYFTTPNYPIFPPTPDIVADLDTLLDTLDRLETNSLLVEEAPEERLPDWMNTENWLFRGTTRQGEVSNLWG